MMSPPVIRIYGKEDVDALSVVCQELQACTYCVSMPYAAAYGGVVWFQTLLARVSAYRIRSILDCGDRAGDVLAALRIGLRLIYFSGPHETFIPLAHIAKHYQARLFSALNLDCDLRWYNDKVETCRHWLTLVSRASRPSGNNVHEM